MNVPASVWWVTLGLTAAVLAVDVFVIGRRPHVPSMRECALALAAYVGAALAFGAGVWIFAGSAFAGQFVAGWLTEYTLSVDNLFVFLLIIARLKVPAALQQSALLVGIVLALVMRGAFIAIGAAAIARFSWAFYVFGAFLVYTAARMATGNAASDEGYHENAALGWVRRVVPTTGDYRGARLLVRGRRRLLATPMLLVVVALGTTDLLFALDSIPAVYGLTREPYLVLTANVFALMGLRQLYFLLGHLLRRLVYLGLGLSVILGFIGVKLVLEALHLNTLPFLNGGRPVSWAPEIPIWLSLVVILVTLGVTTVASLARTSKAAGPPPGH